MHQTNFFDSLRGTWWAQIREDSDHRVFKPGRRFLVVEERGEILGCWKDGIKPPLGTVTILHRKYLERI